MNIEQGMLKKIRGHEKNTGTGENLGENM